MATNGSFTSTYVDSTSNTITLLEFSWTRSSFSVNNNTSSITWTATGYTVGSAMGYRQDYIGDIQINGVSVLTETELLDGTASSNTKSKTVTKTITISHTRGQTANLVIQPVRYTKINYPGSQGTTKQNLQSKTYVVDAVPQPATLSAAPNFNDEGNPMITYSNPSGNLVTAVDACISFTGAKDDVPYRAVPKTGTSYTFSLTEAERAILRKGVATGSSTTVRFYLRSIIDGNPYYSNVTRTLTLINYEPTLNPTVIDTNSKTVELTGDSSVLVKYYSTAQFDSGASAKKEATIVSQYITNGKNTIDNTTSGSIENVDSGIFNFGMTDSRGFSTTATHEAELIPYYKPTISLSVLPFSLAGDLTFTLKGKYFNDSFGARENSFNISYVIVESGQSLETATYQSVPRSASSIVGDDYTTEYTISNLDPEKSYQLMVRIQDSLDASYASRQSIAAAPIFDWGRKDFNFNVPVYLKDTEIPLEGLSDYVTLQGNDGDWFYRLWYSGKVELFGTQEIYDEACTTGLGGWYRTSVQTSPTYPFTINNPEVTATYESAGYGALIWPTTNSTNSRPFDYYLIRPTSSAGITGKVVFRVIGDLGGQIA